jgi:hypothetical protein
MLVVVVQLIVAEVVSFANLFVSLLAHKSSDLD